MQTTPIDIICIYLFILAACQKCCPFKYLIYFIYFLFKHFLIFLQYFIDYFHMCFEWIIIDIRTVQDIIGWVFWVWSLVCRHSFGCCPKCHVIIGVLQGWLFYWSPKCLTMQHQYSPGTEQSITVPIRDTGT